MSVDFQRGEESNVGLPKRCKVSEERLVSSSLDQQTVEESFIMAVQLIEDFDMCNNVSI